MKDFNDDERRAAAGRQPLVVRVTDHDFQQECLEKLSRLETKMEMLIGTHQPGRMKLAEDRIMALERSEIRRSVYDRILTPS
jgi:ABC-type polysaccharide/polyol phosphate transport system ATPase subunit